MENGVILIGAEKQTVLLRAELSHGDFADRQLRRLGGPRALSLRDAGHSRAHFLWMLLPVALLLIFWPVALSVSTPEELRLPVLIYALAFVAAAVLALACLLDRRVYGQVFGWFAALEEQRACAQGSTLSSFLSLEDPDESLCTQSMVFDTEGFFFNPPRDPHFLAPPVRVAKDEVFCVFYSEDALYVLVRDIFLPARRTAAPGRYPCAVSMTRSAFLDAAFYDSAQWARLPGALKALGYPVRPLDDTMV